MALFTVRLVGLQMRAALLENIGNLKLVNLKSPKCSSNELLIKVQSAGICPTDIKMIFHGHRDLVLPRILGHEISGKILKVGKNVKYYREGSRVQIAPGIACGSCYYCLNYAQNMCDHIRIIGFHYDGGFAEYIVIPSEGISSGCINLIPDNLSFEEATLAEPIACCINALQLINLRVGESIVIFGAGLMGCLFIQLARVFGAAKIIVVENNPQRLDFSKNFGADYYICNLKLSSLTGEVKRITNRGADGIVVACSDKSVPSYGVEMLAKKGRIVFFSGIMKEHSNILIDHNLIHYKELQILGAYGCTSQQNNLALKLISRGQVKVKKLISHCIKLNEIKKGIEMVKNHQAMKVIINKFEEGQNV